MTRIRRRLLIDTSVIGITLTLLISVLDLTTRILRPLEDWFYDRRATLCQRFTPSPTDKLIHVDIDDAALAAVGRWPWPRAHLAMLIDEIDRAGAKVIALDVIFPDASRPRIEEKAAGSYVRIDDDAILAESIRRSGKVLMPVAMSLERDRSSMFARVRGYLLEDLELSEDDCNTRLVAEPDKPLGNRPRLPTNAFLAARREAMALRVGRELQRGDISLEALRERLLPKTDQNVRGSVQLTLLAETYHGILARRELARFLLEPPPGLPPLASYNSELAQVPAFSKAALTSGYVNYLDQDRTVRTLPLLVEYRGKLLPQLNLALACAMLGADIRQVKISPDRVVIPATASSKEIAIPVRMKYSPEFNRNIGLVMDIPFRGQSAWETIYDHGRYEKRALHLPAAYIWEVYTIRERITRNGENLDDAVLAILGLTDPDKAEKYNKNRLAPDDVAGREKLAQSTLKDFKESVYAELPATPDKDLKTEEEKATKKRLAAALAVLDRLVKQNGQFAQILSDRRAELRERIGGRAVLVGWTATSLTDFVTTPIQPRCPGVVVHGMIFNAIMTGEFWKQSPAWVTFLFTIGIGLIITAANGFLKPSGALLVAVAVGVAYLLINGYLLFDYGNWCVGVAGPMVALGSVWATGALAGFLIEAAERARITKRFSSYVDPKLVDYVVEKPDAVLDGQVREMSVIFTDLQGFTTLSEQLKERTVSILSDYLTRMVPIIRKHDGFVNKFLGDGIMCFFNAPMDDPAHAAHAVQACLEMQIEVDHFADALVSQGLPRLRMRCGVSTGNMVVGDSGPRDACDYTVLGDAVNLASRLEGANKAAGTRILVTERTVELAGSKFLFRPVGRLQVVGKSEGEMTFEPLALAESANGEQKALAIACEKLVAAYVVRNFARCIELANQLDEQFGPSKLAALYRRISQEYIEAPPGSEFAGNLVLKEK